MYSQIVERACAQYRERRSRARATQRATVFYIQVCIQRMHAPHFQGTHWSVSNIIFHYNASTAAALHTSRGIVLEIVCVCVPVHTQQKYECCETMRQCTFHTRRHTWEIQLTFNTRNERPPHTLHDQIYAQNLPSSLVSHSNMTIYADARWIDAPHPARRSGWRSAEKYHRTLDWCDSVSGRRSTLSTLMGTIRQCRIL